MRKENELSGSLEDYLEAILFIAQQQTTVRIKHLVSHLGVKAPSVNAALKRLEKGGYIHYRHYSHVELTPRGRREAGVILGKHRLIYRFLTNILGIHPRVAQEDACRMEHILSRDTLEGLKVFMENVGPVQTGFQGDCKDDNPSGAVNRK